MEQDDLKSFVRDLRRAGIDAEHREANGLRFVQFRVGGDGAAKLFFFNESGRYVGTEEPKRSATKNKRSK